MSTDSPIQFVSISESRCNGCVLCMKACPTRAIRVINNRLAQITGVCIQCGECVRTCPRGAVKFVTSGPPALNGTYACVSTSSALYVQFGEKFLPNDVLLALMDLNLGYVHDTSYTSELCNIALEFYLEEKRQSPESVRPLISPFCPVVIRTIYHRFPSLIKHIAPLLPPREIVAREAKKRLSTKYYCHPEDIKVLHVTPCAAQFPSVQGPPQRKSSHIDCITGIGAMFRSINAALRSPQHDKVLHHSGGVGLGWATIGGEIAGLEMNCLAISGLKETILYLSKIEMGLFKDIDYIEFRTCPEGCIGGPLAVADKYQAKHHLQRLVRQFGLEKRVKEEYVKKLYAQGWFLAERKDQALDQRDSGISIAERIEKESRVEEILEKLPRKECGSCGCPDCRTFAEDVVNGMTSLEKCFFLAQNKNTRGLAGEWQRYSKKTQPGRSSRGKGAGS